MPQPISQRANASLPYSRHLPSNQTYGKDTRVRRALVHLKRILRKMYGERFRGLYLYGSYARGDATLDSDVDTLITLAGPVQPYQELDRLSQSLAHLCLRYDLLITAYPIPEAWLHERASPLFENIRREGIRI